MYEVYCYFLEVWFDKTILFIDTPNHNLLINLLTVNTARQTYAREGYFCLINISVG